MDTGSDDLTLTQAASLARLSPKTLRRAISRSELPRRYRDTPYGAQLLVSRTDLARWLDARLPRGASPLQALGTEQTTRRLEARLAELSWSVGVLGDRVSDLEQRLDRVDSGQSSVVGSTSPNAIRPTPYADEVFPLPASLPRPPCAPEGAPRLVERWWQRALRWLVTDPVE